MPLAVSLVGCADNNLEVGMTLTQGETVAQRMVLSAGHSAINLTGYTAKMQINFASPLLLTTENGGITFPAAASGVMQINMSYDTTRAFIPGSYPYNLAAYSGDNSYVVVTLGGQFTVLQNVLETS